MKTATLRMTIQVDTSELGRVMAEVQRHTQRWADRIEWEALVSAGAMPTEGV